MIAKIFEGGDRTVDGSLTTQLLQHLCGSSKSVSRLSDGNVEDELLDAQLLHGIGVFSFGHFCGLFVVVEMVVVGQKCSSRSSRAEYFGNLECARQWPR